MYGCYKLGYIERSDGRYEGVAGAEIEYYSTKTVTVEGDVDHLDLEIVGEDSCVKAMYFQYSNYGDMITFVDRETESEQTYTNIVGYREY